MANYSNLILSFILFGLIFFMGFHFAPLIKTESAIYISNQYGGNISNNTIYFPQKYLQRVRNDYANRQYEVAYCIDLSGNDVSNMYVANIINASQGEVIFSCPTYSEGTLHTHPNGIPLPSKMDLNTWSHSTDEINCIYAHVLNCWNEKNGSILKDKIISN